MPRASQSRLTHDPATYLSVGIGNGVKTTFDTPFVESRTLAAEVDGVTVPGITLSRGTGSGGVDRVVFAVAPAAGAGVNVTADEDAINLTELEAALADASDYLDGLLCGRYIVPITSDAALRIIRIHCILLTKWFLAQRRGIGGSYPEYEKDAEASIKYITDAGQGDAALPADTTRVGSPAPSASSGFVGSETVVFSQATACL
ncbi:MAG: phage protein Gp36 family protein [Thermoanaerobaculia bacterium]